MTIRTSAKEFEIKVVPLKQQLHFTSPVRKPLCSSDYGFFA